MAQIFDSKLNKIIEVDSREAATSLVLEPERYSPVKDSKYMVVDNNTGSGEMVSGQNLYQSIGDGKSLTDLDDLSELKTSNSAARHIWEFGKSFLNEAFLLGLGSAFKKDPTNPYEQMKAEDEQELFGGTRSFGRGAGMVVPWLLGGLGGFIKLGAKTAIKKGLKPLIKYGKKAPSAQVITKAIQASDKAGDFAKLKAKQMGAGKLSQSAAEIAGKSIGYAGVIGGVQFSTRALSEGIKEYRSPLKDSIPEGERVNRIFSNAIGKGFESGAEAFTSTAILGTVFGGVGKGFGFLQQGLGKGLNIVSKAKGPALSKVESGKTFSIKSLRQSFLKANQGNIDNLRISFKTGKKMKDEDVLKLSSDFLIKRFGKDNLIKRDLAISVLKKDVNNLGEQIGKAREAIGKYTRKTKVKGRIKYKRTDITKDDIHDFLDSLKRIPNRYEASTTLAGFIRTIDKLKGGVTGRPGFKSIRNITDVLKKQAKFEKTTQTPAAEAYQKAYRMATKYENKITDKIKIFATDEVKKLEELKSIYSKSKSILTMLEKPIKSPFGFGGYYLSKDAIVILGGSLGVTGTILYGPMGALLAAGAFGGFSYLRNTGYRMLNFANHLENTNKIMNQVKTHQGVAKILEFPTGTLRPFKSTKTKMITDNLKDAKNLVLHKSLRREPVKIASLGHFFFEKPVKDIKEFDETLNSYNEIDQISKGQEIEYIAAQEYGGQKMTQSLINSLSKLKQYILRTKPKPFIDPDTGESYYSDIETELWLNDVDAVSSIQGFLDAVKNKSITKDQYTTFESFYPNFLIDFNVSLVQGLKNGSIEKTDVVDNYMFMMKDNIESDIIFYNLDQMNKMKEGEISGRRHQQFNSRGRSAPTQSNIASSGGFQ